MTSKHWAVLRAADHIDKHPERFDFRTLKTPLTRFERGCALGWIAFFVNDHLEPHSDGYLVNDFCEQFFGISDTKFYERMRRLEVGTSSRMITWPQSAAICADTLRKYAQRYLAPVRQPTRIAEPA